LVHRALLPSCGDSDEHGNAELFTPGDPPTPPPLLAT
jgi:hypothetical protein